MSTPHPLNQAVVAQALHDLRNGQLRRCLAMGFGQQELDVLKQPGIVALLANAHVPWCTVTVNKNVLWRLISQIRDIQSDITNIDRMLKLGASTEMICTFYGLTHQEVALRREVLGLPKRKGRHPVLTEEQEAELWRRWKPLIAERDVPLGENTGMLSLAMDLAESLNVPLSVVWSSIRGWLDQGLA